MKALANPSETGQLYAGLMSGTSMDGIDAGLFRLGDRTCETVATHSHPYPEDLRELLLAASRTPDSLTVDAIGRLDHWVGECFRDAALALLENCGVSASRIVAIGSHGQTIRHQPRAARPFSMQIGDPNIIASGTGVTTVADFRRRDIAVGGEGAPLAPAFHRWLFAAEDDDRVVLNIGGFANVTILPARGGEVTGFDTGPGNTLLDAWIRREKGLAFDESGTWASSGTIIPDLLERLLGDRYFSLEPPKSTGFEYFNLDWLTGHAQTGGLDPADIQATLLALTVRSIADAIGGQAPGARQVLVCGGGVRNVEMMRRLAQAIPFAECVSTDVFGLDPDWVEAAAFAWLARQTLAGQPGNLPSVTGAARPEVLGGIYMCAG